MTGEELKNNDIMCCCWCGFINYDDKPYETDTTSDGEDFPICPECRKDNCGGYQSFASSQVWPVDELKRIIELSESC